MRVAQLAPSYHSVSPLFNKAIYSHIAWLANGLVDLGHDVHLFASSDSETKAVLHGVSESLSKLNLPEDIARYYMLLTISSCYAYARTSSDIIHSHFNLLSSFVSQISDVPTVTSVHSPITDRTRPLLEHFKNERYISFSLAQRKQMPNLNWYANIYHGVDTALFAFNPDPEEYLLYLGRVTEEKGIHFAIEAAKVTGMPLYIVGASYPAEGYWQKHVEPHIDGRMIRFLGEASFERKIPLFQNAKALLFPTQADEVFGYSMIEAMSCGTPVIGFANGSVAEIVKHGIAGFVVNDVEEMVEAIKHLDEIDRMKVRKRAEIYFSVEKMVSGYEKVYKRVLDDETFLQRKRDENANMSSDSLK
ncbi:TPA: glycosyl transferase [Candidatus Kaiserbacteria bacterium]|nr:MAG: glycosyltransferase [Parcubacteria group bacterium GW2011_GWA1_56_13]KKW46899.1 MAG: glycosyltransferase [Parcubacteria group bacterium GW2011_GWB1_57_6]HCR52631.1 glycosyl transferase [Candidatus Kaiserbacteria bacterium]